MAALRASQRIQGAARRRQGARAVGEANAAASLDTDLRELYEDYNGDRRELFATGLVPNGTPYKGRTWKAQ